MSGDVYVTHHASGRLRWRFPELRLDEREATNLAATEVLAALADGRRAKSAPAWLQASRYRAANAWWIWNIARSRCYVVRRRRRAETGKKYWVVLTTIRPPRRGENGGTDA